MPNLRLALRTLFKSPFITLVAILSLALGIGANSAIFSLFDQMLLRPLPVPNAARAGQFQVARARSRDRIRAARRAAATRFSATRCSGTSRRRRPASPASPRIATSARSIGYQGTSLSGEGLLVSGSYFPVLGLDAGARPAAHAGRRQDRRQRTSSWCSATTTGAPGSSSIPTVLNETLVVNGQAMTIVGVAPRGFNGTTLGNNPDVFVPLTMRGLMQPGLQRLRESPPVLGVPVRAPEAGRVDRAGHGRDQRTVSRRSSTTSKRRCRRA